MKNIFFNHKSFSLVEVLVFVVVLGLFFVAAMSVVTFNVKNMKIQEHKIIATRYAEEAVEWLRQEKEDDWSKFILRSSSDTYCVNGSLDWIEIDSNPCIDYDLGSIYKRGVAISYIPGSEQVNTVVTVEWKDMGTDLEVKIRTVFKLLE